MGLDRDRADTPLGLRKLDSSLPVPLYHQAYLAMKREIVEGGYIEGDRFPTESELCRVLDVSRITVKRALAELTAEGWIARHRGRGTVVKASKSKGVMRADFAEMMQNLLHIGDTTDIRVIEVADTDAPVEIASDLELGAARATRRFIRLRSIDGEPYVLTVSYLPADVAAKFPEDGAQRRPMLRLLIDSGFVPKEAYQRMTATAADSETAIALGLPAGAPVLKVTRVFKTAASRPVQHTTMYFRPDRYEYTLVLPAGDALD